MDSRLRIGYLVSRYPAVSHTFILREVVLLRQHGIDIDVASINSPDRSTEGLTAEERSEAARTFYVKAAGAGGALRAQWSALASSPGGYFRALMYALSLGGTDIRRLGLCFFYFVEAALLADWMQRRRLRHLHVHFGTPAATVGLILTRLAPVTMSMTVHGPDEFYDVPGYYLPQKIETCKFACAIGQYARSQLMKLSPVRDWGKLLVSPLGVDPGQFVPRKPKEAGDAFEVLCVGRLVPAKGQHVLLSAIAALRTEGRRVNLRFVGDGPDRAALEQHAHSLGIGNATYFEGAVNQDVIRRFYDSADVFVLASFAEGIPVVLMEAMAMEIPCITTWITGIPELIRNGQDGLLVPPGDSSVLARAIATLMDDADTRGRLAKAGRLRILERYNLTENIRLLAAIFHSQLGSAA